MENKPTHLYQIMPPLTDAEYQALKNDIRQNGLLLPILVDESGNILDGHHRTQICQELKIKNVPYTIKIGLNEQEKINLVLATNLTRRHMTRDQREQLCISLSAERGFSLRKIAEMAGISHESVRRLVNRDAIDTAGVTNVTGDGDLVIGRDGKNYPKRRPPTTITARSSQDAAKTIAALQDIQSDLLPATTMDGRRFDRFVRDHHLRQQRKADRSQSADVLFDPNPSMILREGDFYHALADIRDGTVDLILTDPPYGCDALESWDKLGDLAARLLRPGGILAAYAGQYYLPHVIGQLSQHLDYVWMIALTGSGPSCAVHARGLNSRWKPILVYCRPPLETHRWFSDLIAGEGPEKSDHPWQQAVNEAVRLIDNFSQPGDLIVDPFLGSGTNAIAAHQLHRRFIGCDIDRDTLAAAAERIAKSKIQSE